MSPFVLALGSAGPPGFAPSLGIGLVVAILLVVLNGFFVAAEFALVKLRPSRLESMADRLTGRLAARMLENLDAFLAASQLGITLTSLGLGWVGAPALAWLLQDVLGLLPSAPAWATQTLSLVLAFLLVATLHIVLGEQLPKAVAIRRPRRTTLWVAVPLWVFYHVTYPVTWLLNRVSVLLLRLVGLETTQAGIAVGEEDIRELLASGQESELPDDQRELLDNIFELSHRTARQVMVPRADVVFLDLARSLEENLEMARQSGHTRFPLCQDDLDHALGLVHIKDIFRSRELPKSLEQIRRDIIFVPETQPIETLLRRMRTERVHMAAVLDEYGGVSGIVTLENVIEEIVGEIQDEFDFERPELVKTGDNQFRVLGSMLVEDLEHELGIEISDRDEDTMAGVALSEIGRRARIGDRIEVGPLMLEVLEVERNRIRSLRVTLTEPESAEGATA